MQGNIQQERQTDSSDLEMTCFLGRTKSASNDTTKTKLLAGQEQAASDNDHHCEQEEADMLMKTMVREDSATTHGTGGIWSVSAIGFHQVCSIVVALSLLQTTLFLHFGAPVWPGMHALVGIMEREMGSFKYWSLVVGVGIPQTLLFSSSFAVLAMFRPIRCQGGDRPRSRLGRILRIANKVWTYGTAGDWSTDTLAMLFVVFPAVAVVLSAAFKAESFEFRPIVLATKNPLGNVAAMAMSWFLVPVARQSPLLVATGWSPVHAIQLHAWAGRIAMWGGVLHMICYLYKYAVTSEEGMWYHIFPPPRCFGWFSPFDLSRDEELWAGRCRKVWRNFWGLMTTVCFFSLGVTSLWIVRRRFYRVFYWSHVCFGGSSIVLLVLHMGKTVFFFGPGVLYYAFCISPVLLKTVGAYCNGGCRLVCSKLLADSGCVAELVLQKSHYTRTVEQGCSSQYVRICIPELSLMWHPFTVASPPGDPDLRILFRRTGLFTSKLYQRVQDTQKAPLILVDGLYSGVDWVAQACRHDKIVMVAGGIGITPFVSVMAQLVCLFDQNTASQRINRIDLHWVCRDFGLVKHIMQDFASMALQLVQDEGCNLENSSSRVKVEIHIHFTGPSTQLDLATIIDADAANISSSENDQNAVPSHDGEPRSTVCLKYSSGCDGNVEAGNGATAGGLLYCVVGWVGLLVAVQTKRNWTRKPATTSNLYPLLAMMVWLVIVVLINQAWKRALQYFFGARYSARSFASCANRSASPEGYDRKYNACLASRQFVANSRVKVSFRLTPGRPDLDRCLQPLSLATYPACFFCGPSSLQTSLRIRAEKTAQQRCAFYAEKFEL